MAAFVPPTTPTEVTGHLRALQGLLSKHTVGKSGSLGKGAQPPPLPAFSSEQLAFLHAFTTTYTNVPTYNTYKDAFEHQPDLVSIVFGMLNSVDANNAPPLLQLAMIFSRSEKNQVQVAKINGIGTLLAVMRKHNVNLAIQEDACRALINIATNDKNRKLIASEGGIDIVLDCLRNGGPSPSLLLAACWTIRNVAVHDANKKLIIQRGGVEQLVRVMDKYPTDGGLQEQACWALMNLSLKEDMRETMVKNGCTRAIVTCMRTFPLERRVQEAGCWAIANLSQNAKCRDTLRQERCIEAVMAANKNFADAEEMQKRVSEAVAAISETTDTAEDDDDESAAKAAVVSTAAMEDLDRAKATQLMIVKKGWLVKQGSVVKNWKKRWFVLDTRKITYFKTQEEQHPLGTVILSSCEGVLEDPNKKFGLMVVTVPRTYRIVATNRHEMAEWMLAIKNVTADLVKTQQRHGSIAASSSSPTPNSPAIAPSGITVSSSGTTETGAGVEVTKPDSLTAKMATSQPFATVDFFAPEEKTPASEIEGVIINQVLMMLETEPHFASVRTCAMPDLAIALITQSILSIIMTSRLKETTILNIRGAPTDTYDALKLEKIVTEILPSTAEKVLQQPGGLTAVHASLAPAFQRTWKHQTWGEQGTRKTMEDRHVHVTYLNEMLNLSSLLPPISIYGVFDGHGGTRAADYIAAHLFVNLVRAIERDVLAAQSLDRVNLIGHIETAFLRTNDDFFDYLSRKSLVDSCGSTAVVAFAIANDFYVCWAGDSEAALMLKDGTTQVVTVPTHKPRDEGEIARVEALGGFVQEINGVKRLNGMLAVTRSFGDARAFVAPKPDIVKITLDGSEDFLILACDGLWDVMSASDVAMFLLSYRKEFGSLTGASKALTTAALERHSSDNVSVVLIEF